MTSSTETIEEIVRTKHLNGEYLKITNSDRPVPPKVKITRFTKGEKNACSE